MSDAFARVLDRTLGDLGVIVFECSDRAAKPLASEIFAHEVTHPGRTWSLAGEAGQRLAAGGYHTQVDGLVAEWRGAVSHRRIANAGRAGRRAGLVDEARTRPETFSPNVLLRPIVEDALFPTVCYVSGPNELAYLAQLRKVYEHFGVPMPLFYPRASATILDSASARFLEKHDLPFEALQARDESALNRLLAASLPESVDRALKEADEAIQEKMAAIIASVPAIDATLEGAAKSTLGKLQHDLATPARQGDQRRQEARRNAAASVLPGAGAGVSRRHSAGTGARQRRPAQPLRPGARPKARAGAAARPRTSLGADALMPTAETQAALGKAACSRRCASARASSRATYPRATKYTPDRRRGRCSSSTCALTGYYYVTFSRMIDARLHGERDRVLPRVFARPLEIRRGDNMSQKELLDRLNDLGYAQRTQVQNPGEFAVDGALVSVVPRAGSHTGKTLVISFQRPRRRDAAGRAPRRADDQQSHRGAVDRQAAGLARHDGRADADGADPGARQSAGRCRSPRCRRAWSQAVLAIEDRRYYSHPGIDPIRMVGALFTNMFGNRPYLEGASTITQQLARNFFLTEEMARRAADAPALAAPQAARAVHGGHPRHQGDQGRSARALSERRLSRQSRIVRDSRRRRGGAALLRQGRHQPLARRGRHDRRHHPVARHAVAVQLAGARARAPQRRAASDGRRPASSRPMRPSARRRSRSRRSRARSMPRRRTSSTSSARRSRSSFRRSRRRPRRSTSTRRSICTCSGSRRMRSAAASPRSISCCRAGAAARVPQAALIAVDPRTGDILAMVGGRSYNQSQFNRAVSANRQPGSVFKPFVYLAAFERAAEDGTALSPATLVNDEPTTFDANGTPWTPANYENEYDGEITLRRALAMSRNAATVKVAEAAGYDRVADLWRRIGAGTAPRAFPSIALGVFEATPLRHRLGVHDLHQRRRDARAAAAAPDSARRDGDRGEGLADQARRARRHDLPRHQHDAQRVERRHRRRRARVGIQPRRRRQDRHDQRPARRVVRRLHARAADGRLGRASTTIRRSASAARRRRCRSGSRSCSARSPAAATTRSRCPTNISFVDIDRDTGATAIPGCLRVFSESFLSGTEPRELCEIHRF